MDPLISVVIPVYNSEKYIKKCIRSVVQQTYKNLEIILVDDGSPDNCGNICEGYAKKDNRIIVIHKENGGLSTARNEGIVKASGEYLFFIDSDDSISNDCIEKLYNCLSSTDTDCAVTALLFVYENSGLTKLRYNKNGEHGVLSNIEAVNTMYYGDKFNVSVCGKLFKKELFKNIRFPEGITHEDAAIIYKVLHACKNISFIGEAKYFYLKRNDGNITSVTDLSKVKSVIGVTEDVVHYMKKNLAECYQSSIHNLVTNQFAMCVKMSLDGKQLKKYYLHMKGNIKKYRMTVISDRYADPNIRMCCVATYLGFRFVRLAWKIYKKWVKG